MVVPITDQLFTAVNIGSVGIASGAVVLVTNTFYKLANLPQKWTAFCTALVIAYLIVFISTSPQWYDWIFAFLNACLLFCTALGLNEYGSPKPDFTQGMVKTEGMAKTEPFIRSWLK
jgi:hypothetical protein